MRIRNKNSLNFIAKTNKKRLKKGFSSQRKTTDKFNLTVSSKEQ